MVEDVEGLHARAVEQIASGPNRTFVIGAVDTGKTTFTRRLVRHAVGAGLVAAVVDADLGQSTVGPPTTVGLKVFRTGEDLDAAGHDALSFVGSDSPRGHLLEHVVGTAKLVMRAIEMGARVIVVDTCGYIGGVAGQTLKLAKVELCRPQSIVAIEQGGELEPITGVLQRFAPVNVVRLPVHPDTTMRSVDDRAAYREARLGAALGPAVHRWRVRPTVFLPSLPPGLELGVLDGLLVGIDDGNGDCLGVGVLEFQEDGLRLITPVAEGVKALRLGSMRVSTTGKILGRVDLRSILGTD